MKADDIMAQDDFKRCADFHGHICPGLTIGYRAGQAALAWLKEHRALDEEMVTTVETNACGTDALFSIQKTRVNVPAKAVIEPSVPCDRCQEPTMVSKLAPVPPRAVSCEPPPAPWYSWKIFSV